jgi:hypothetical protein
MAGSANVILSVHSVRESFEEITGDELQLWPFPRELEGVIPHVDYLMPNRIEATPDGAPKVVALSDALGTKYGDFVVAVYEGAVPPSDEVASAEKLGVQLDYPPQYARARHGELVLVNPVIVASSGAEVDATSSP